MLGAGAIIAPCTERMGRDALRARAVGSHGELVGVAFDDEGLGTEFEELAHSAIDEVQSIASAYRLHAAG